MSLDVVQDGKVVVIDIAGSLSAAYSPRLREAIGEVFKSNARGVIVDMSGVVYMDSSGLATLVEGVQLAEESQGKFVLAGLIRERIQHLFEITRLDGLFEQFENSEAAKNHLFSALS